jgi:hypothetical protein
VTLSRDVCLSPMHRARPDHVLVRGLRVPSSLAAPGLNARSFDLHPSSAANAVDYSLLHSQQLTSAPIGFCRQARRCHLPLVLQNLRDIRTVFFLHFLFLFPVSFLLFCGTRLAKHRYLPEWSRCLGRGAEDEAGLPDLNRKL